MPTPRLWRASGLRIVIFAAVPPCETSDLSFELSSRVVNLFASTTVLVVVVPGRLLPGTLRASVVLVVGATWVPCLAGEIPSSDGHR